MILDRILVLISLFGLVAFAGAIIIYVREPDLVVTVLIILILATHDFWTSVFRPQEATMATPSLEERYTAPSGKTVDSAKELAADLESSVRTQRVSRSKEGPVRKSSASTTKGRKTASTRGTGKPRGAGKRK